MENRRLVHINSIGNTKFFKLVCRLSPYRFVSTNYRTPKALHQKTTFRTLAFLLLTAIVLVTVTVNTSHADTKSPRASEYQIKAAYLYNFLLFTQWPAPITDEKSRPDSDTAIIGIVGEDPFGTFFDEVEGRTIKIGDVKKKLIIKRFGPYSNTIDLTHCRLLFVSASEKSHLNQIIAKVQDAPVLTVGDTERFLESGGMIKLVKVKEKIRWEINRGPIASAELRLDSMLLKSATRVIGNQ